MPGLSIGRARELALQTGASPREAIGQSATLLRKDGTTVKGKVVRVDVPDPDRIIIHVIDDKDVYHLAVFRTDWQPIDESLLEVIDLGS
jgi:hypothetical protein